MQNDFKTPQGHISGHILSFRSISVTLSKFEFLTKIDFLANFEIFDFSKYDLLFGRKWPEIVSLELQNTSTELNVEDVQINSGGGRFSLGISKEIPKEKRGASPVNLHVFYVIA